MLGILMLDTRFPRPVGDIGHAGSFAFAVRHRVVRGADPAFLHFEVRQGFDSVDPVPYLQ